MDGGSSLNIIYLETLDLLSIDKGRLQPSAGGFHGVVPGKKALPVGRIDLPVCFGTAANFRKETLTFEVVGFRGTYHAIIRCPGYAKFMAIPNYTYLKLKMPGPKGVITVSSSFKHAYECDVECVEYGKHQQNQKCICYSLTLSIVSKTKLMDNKITSVAFKTFVRSDRST